MLKVGDLIPNINIPSQHLDLWEKIPHDVKELLWYTGEIPKPKNHYGFNMLEFSVDKGAKFHALCEPSTIYFVLPLQVPADNSLVEKLPFMPTYARLNPEQRYVYLTWLQNVTIDIDIGYRFLFYYGLERHIVIGDFEKPFNMIARLRKATSNTSFLSHSANALLYGALKSQDMDYLEKLRFLFDDDIWIDIQIITKVLMKEPIEPYEIPRILKAHTVNKRYLNEKIYAEEMRMLLSERYGQPFLSKGIFEVERNNNYGLVFANNSFPRHIRENKSFALPAIDEPLAIIKDLHGECHERVKKRIAELKKNNWRSLWD